jgi:hypothetical protein
MLKHATDLINYNYYKLFVPTNVHTYIKTLNYIKYAPACFGASAPSSGRFDTAFANVKKC